ncbi:lactate dehydrogenase-like 2-hydroxyacid dehydrogenase [Pseudomonas hunanensis]|uniref:Lactate dehydrogenase-like 2-hydroxyacid dehydrogenase n=1 Tax=Pseudomonas hunanensis TaxID=1247546 RepID=A0ACC6K0Z9_9PSED|nr:2-hydroxyacid dehydrogenase [Pseudomonas hunanensis]MDR6712100.1 lactate dehydrogenase-like 2-hydroxyacid dehydrogenase [Pseudomonas hunanensis]
MNNPDTPIDLLLTQPVPDAIDEVLLREYRVHRLYQQQHPQKLLAEIGPQIRGVVTGGAKGLSNALMDQLPALQIIAISGIGTDAVDLAHAAKRNIHVTTTPGVLTDDVADMAIGLIIATLRRLGEGERLVREGLWGTVNLPLARKVSGINLGIVGLGRVGHAIAKRALAFDMRIAYCDRREQAETGYRFVGDLSELARSVEVLVLAASADDGKAIITREVLEALGPDGYLINVARGKLVDEEALVDALRERRIAGAGLDVFVDEPQVPPALRDLAQVSLQPHRASATLQTRLDMGRMVLDNLAACFRGELPPHRV